MRMPTCRTRTTSIGIDAPCLRRCMRSRALAIPQDLHPDRQVVRSLTSKGPSCATAGMKAALPPAGVGIADAGGAEDIDVVDPRLPRHPVSAPAELAQAAAGQTDGRTAVPEEKRLEFGVPVLAWTCDSSQKPAFRPPPRSSMPRKPARADAARSPLRRAVDAEELCCQQPWGSRQPHDTTADPALIRNRPEAASTRIRGGLRARCRRKPARRTSIGPSSPATAARPKTLDALRKAQRFSSRLKSSRPASSGAPARYAWCKASLAAQNSGDVRRIAKRSASAR